ncbi:BCCT family transporter [Chakrabartyella piscis]|uniref:BCCT family transporter n=1 Tax=Chakrabartyella piscis TaxID=2918914 RepID=UPI0029589362|nr:BCCT family transporter [Chakrabartyella piscis]
MNEENKNIKKSRLSDQYEVGLMVVSLIIIAVFTISLTLYPEQSNALAGKVFAFLTRTLASPIQSASILMILFMTIFALSKYGNVRLGRAKPDYSTFSWLAMIFFCLNGAGTMYWAFIEWGFHYNAAPYINGVETTDAFLMEMALAYTFFDWGPSDIVWILIFTIPFTYWFHLRENKKLHLATMCTPVLGEKAINGMAGKIINFIFIFSVVGSIAITAGSAATTIGTALADMLKIERSFSIAIIVLLGTAIIFSISSFVGIEKGIKRLSDGNIWLLMAILLMFLVCSDPLFIVDSMSNAIGLMFDNYIRMNQWTDPVARSWYPQDWNVFYFLYGLIFGPLTGMFAAKISRGRTIKEMFFGMMVATVSGLILLHGVVAGYQQNLMINGGLNIPELVGSNALETASSLTMQTLPFPTIALAAYSICTIVFLATTLDASAFTLSSTITKELGLNEEPNKYLKLVWCVVLIAIPMGIAFAGTDTTTIRTFVMVFGLPLFAIVFIAFKGLLQDLRLHYKHMTADEIRYEGLTDEERAERDEWRKMRM